MVKFLRESILDDIGGTGVVWQDITEDLDEAQQLRWTNEELTSFLNEAIRTACRSAMLIKEENALFDIAVTADQATYALHEKVLEVLDAYYDSNGKSLTKVEIEEIRSNPSWRTQTSEMPLYYIVDYNTGTITLYPTPSASETIHIFATRLPLTDLDWAYAETDTHELNSRYDLPFIHGAAYFAYMKDEANSFDPGRSEYFRNLFEREFGHLSHYGANRRSRTKNKTIRYGGL